MKSVNKILVTLTAFVLCITFLVPRYGMAQVVNASTKKRISIGVGLFTDIWMNTPAGMKTRTINQGVQVFGTYNMPFGKSNFSFAIGLEISIHNLYWNYYFNERGGDTLQFSRIPDDISHKRSKLTMPYIEVPVEFRLKTKSKVSVGIGFKVGYMVYAHSKWVGEDYLWGTSNTLKSSFKGIRNIEKLAYGPTLRIGYKWFNVNGYYSLSKIFLKDKGIDMYPISVGFVLMPF
ncbi:MAG: outer membrane beta-barrel protein [Bacteroidetes bacterium]|nr:outer membrane beta-barrel protein [Bacteroidota bacterium]